MSQLHIYFNSTLIRELRVGRFLISIIFICIYFEYLLSYIINYIYRCFILYISGEHKIDNPDQRISSDIQIFSNSYAAIVVDMILCPLLVIYYAYDAYTRADWIGPTGIFVMFLVSIIINRLLMPAVVKATVEHEKYEGYFRYAHANIRTNSESLAFCGTEAAIFEKDQQVHTFDLSQHSFLLSK